MKSKTILEVKVLHAGWEMDYEAWITEGADGVKKFHTTSHGSPCEMDQQYTMQKIKETEDSLCQLIDGARMMGWIR